MKQFWMVWNQGGNAPRYKHETEALAIGEAERLARMNPSDTFIVLEATHVRRVDNMQRADLRSNDPETDDIPF